MADTVTSQTPQRRYELTEQANRKVFRRLVPFLAWRFLASTILLCACPLNPLASRRLPKLVWIL